MKKIVIIFGVLLSTLSFGQEIHRGHSLSDQYHAEIEMAAKRGAYSSSAYRLAFSIENVSAREACGNIPRAIDLQGQIINVLLS